VARLSLLSQPRYRVSGPSQSCTHDSRSLEYVFARACHTLACRHLRAPVQSNWLIWPHPYRSRKGAQHALRSPSMACCHIGLHAWNLTQERKTFKTEVKEWLSTNKSKEKMAHLQVVYKPFEVRLCDLSRFCPSLLTCHSYQTSHQPSCCC